MRKKSPADELLKEFMKKKGDAKREYAINKTASISEEELLEIKYQYKASGKVLLPWTVFIALCGFVVSFLINQLGEDLFIWIPFAILVVGMCYLIMLLHKELYAKEYLLLRIEERLDELKQGSHKAVPDKTSTDREYIEIINCIKDIEEKKEMEVRKIIAEKMLVDEVLSQKKIEEYCDVEITKVNK